MLEASQAVIRSIALAALTVLFAGVWGSDRPDHPSVAFLPADQRTFVIDIQQSPDQISRSASVAALRDLRQTTQTKAIPVISRSISIDAGQLTITRDVLSRHVSRLPIGLAAGDYRLVDSQGGVGWLHVRGLAAGLEAEISDGTLTTDVNGDRLSIIRVKSGAATTASGQTSIRR